MSNPQPDTILLEDCRWKLLKLWFLTALVIFIPLVAMCFLRSEFRDHWPEVIDWFLPNVAPTLALIGSVVAANAVNPRPNETRVSRRFYVLTFWCSVFYLALTAMPFVIEPLVRDYDILEVIRISNLWMGIIQTLVVAQIAVLFFPPKSKEKEAASGNAESE